MLTSDLIISVAFPVAASFSQPSRLAVLLSFSPDIVCFVDFPLLRSSNLAQSILRGNGFGWLAGSSSLTD